MSTGLKVGLAAAGAAAAAAAAGYYFYASENASGHRKLVSKWAGDLKRTVVREAKKVKKLNSVAIGKIVDEAAQAYHNVRSIDQKDVSRAAAELKKNWKNIQAELTAEPVRATSKKKAVKTKTRASKRSV